MLVAKLGTDRIDAVVALRGPAYLCPNPKCNGLMILRKGRIKVAHFAHKPPMTCSWATGETQQHLEAKRVVADALAARKLEAQIECVVDTLPGDRRADVMAWSPKGLRIAFELQHTPISLDEIESRASSYARAGIAQIWIPFLKSSAWKDGKPIQGGWLIERYAPRPFEKWVHGFNGKNGMWMYDPTQKKLWLGKLEGHQTYVDETSWYSEGGDENYGGGFHKWSKRYRKLTLHGPHEPDKLLVKVTFRNAYSTKDYSWPAGRVAHLVPA